MNDSSSNVQCCWLVEEESGERETWFHDRKVQLDNSLWIVTTRSCE
jgi:hypothetical protein